jgi:hypothetical protein
MVLICGCLKLILAKKKLSIYKALVVRYAVQNTEATTVYDTICVKVDRVAGDDSKVLILLMRGCYLC